MLALIEYASLVLIILVLYGGTLHLISFCHSSLGTGKGFPSTEFPSSPWVWCCPPSPQVFCIFHVVYIYIFSSLLGLGSEGMGVQA